MSADLSSDPAIAHTYGIIQNQDSPLDWLVLHYAPEGPKDRLVLLSSGEGGLSALKSSLIATGSSAIYFGILRVEGRILLYTILPEDTGGVKRARALVHSRAVGSKLQHQATLTVSRVEELSEGLVRNKLKLDTGSASSSLPPSPNPQAFHSGPSPLRSNFSPTLSASSFSNGTQHSPKLSEDASAPQIPEKDQAQLARMRSNVSLRSAASARLSPNPQSAQTFQRAASPTALHANTTERSRSPSGSGLGIGVTPQMYAVPRSPSLQVHAPQTSSAMDAENSYKRDHLVSTNVRESLPGALEDTTLQSMLTSDDPDTSIDTSYTQPASPQPRSSTNNASQGSRRVSTEVERQRVAESIARAAEERWHAHRRSSSQPRPIVDIQEEGNISQTSAASPSSPKLRHRLQRELSLEQGRLRNLQLEQQQLQEVQHQVEEPKEVAADEELRQEEEGQHSNTAYERERLLQVQHAEEERLAALKEEEQQLLNYRRHVEEEARLAEQAKREEEERQLREAEEEKVRTEEEDRRRRSEEERLAKEEAERQEQERREAEARAIREAQEAEARAAQEAREAEERAQQAEKEAAEALVRQKAEAKLALRENIRTRLANAQDPNVPVLTGFVSAQGGGSILWRRRYFELTPSTLNLYKNDKDRTKVIDAVSLPSRIRAVELNAEELMAIPHSFKLFFQDSEEEPMLFYCDEEDDKELLVYALKLAGRV